MKISRITGMEIYDSRGNPTLSCRLFLEDGHSVEASVPSGASRGSHEAHELRDGGDRLGGKGVLRAVSSIDEVISPALAGKEPNVIALDIILLDLDGTDQKKNLGANTVLAVSIAVVKAQAYVEGVPVFQLISELCDKTTVSVPIPLCNVINGGMHADNSLSIQEYMVIPMGASSFRGAMETLIEFFYKLRSLFKKQGRRVAFGDEGGISADFSSDQEPLDLIAQVCDSMEHVDGKLQIALDVAASELYDKTTGVYRFGKKKYDAGQLLEWYQTLVDEYALFSIEDGFAENDSAGWKKAMEVLGQDVQLVGDDLFVTQSARILDGLEQGLANAVLIKPNQVGTVTETLQAILLSQEHGLNTIVSHRSGETTDTFIADLAVGASVNEIKAGGCTRGERLAKYNRLLEIEDQLTQELMI